MSELAYFLGLDPGVSGGIAIVDHLGLVFRAVQMPATEHEILEALEVPESQRYREEQDVVEFYRPARRAVLEKVNAGVFGHGKVGRMGVSSAFTFGRGVGRLEMALCASRIAFDAVSPQAWQAALGCKSGGDKNVTKRRAQQLFPSQKVTHATADALLLAEFCRRYWRQIAGKGSVDGKTEDSYKVSGSFVSVGALGKSGALARALGVDTLETETAAAGAPGDGARPKPSAR